MSFPPDSARSGNAAHTPIALGQGGLVLSPATQASGIGNVGGSFPNAIGNAGGSSPGQTTNDAILLETGLGLIELEDGSGVIVLET